jgi:hypothetical protein
MTRYHWGGIVALLLLGYLIGIWYPGPGVQLRTRIGM